MVADDVRESRRRSYETARGDIQRLVPASARRILDLGCAAGDLGAALKRRQPATVVGIELMPEYAHDAARVLDHVVCADIDRALADADALGRFDCVIAADVLEHLIDPWHAMRRVAELLDPGGTVVVSLPNVRYALTFWTLLRRGRWPRDPSGLFDATHLRWFTLTDARELLTQAGLEVELVRPRYWFRGSALAAVKVLSRTPLREFLPGQYALVGRKPW